MATPLRLLILEDNPSDAEMMLHTLRHAGYDPIFNLVDTEQDFLDHLQPALEIVLADFSGPEFNALNALELMQERQLDVPVIIVSGSIGEEHAVRVMQRGATDYIIKDRMERLGHAVTKALEQKRLRDANQQAERALRESEKLTQEIQDAKEREAETSRQEHEKTVAVNEALMLGSLRQHELTKVAEDLNAQLQVEITERKRAELLATFQKDTLQLLAEGASLDQVLDFLARAMENQSRDNFLVAIHLLEQDGWHFGQVTAPSLPASYSQATRGMDTRLQLDTCSAAVMSGTPTLVRDFAAETRWPAFTAEMVSLGLRGCFTTPIFSTGQRILGAFAIYYRVPCDPSPSDRQLVDIVTRTTSIAIERKQAEELLRRSEGNLRDFVENAAIGLHWVGPDGIILWANQTELDLLGYTREEYFGHHIAEFHADPLVIKDILDRLTGGETLFDYEARLRCKDGSVRHVVINSNTLVENKKFVHTRCFTRDITERKGAEEAMRAGERRLRFVMDSMPQKIVTTDADGGFDYFNPQWSEFTGLPVEQIKGWGWKQSIHPDDLAETGRVWQHSIDTGEASQSEQRMRRSDGEYRWHLSRWVPMRDAAGKVVMWIGSSTDVHEVKEAGQRKDEFLALLAHELRNPLAPIRNMVEVLKRADGRSDLIEPALATMERQLQLMTRLIDDLLDVSRISQGKIELRQEKIELASVIHHVVEASQPACDAARQQLTVALPPQPVYLFADPVRLAQVFGNLLHNACKFTKPGGRISLTVERQGGDVVVTVRDSGVGIPSAMLPKIFELFTQGDQTLERSHGGLGIGLTLVRRLAEMHGGSVQAFSEGVDRGSEFAVRLPMLIEQRKALSPEPAVAAPAPVTARRILVVDDNHDSANSLSVLLKLTGNQTQLAFDGVEAVEAAASFRPDLILMDIGMPKLNGYAAARQIREQPWGKDMVLVALTGWGQDEDRKKTAEAGFDDHLVKPVNFAVLTKLLAGFPAAASLR